MDTYPDQILDSPSKNSYIGSYYQPPDRILPKEKETPVSLLMSMNLQSSSPQVSRTTPNVDSKAVIDALKSLQEKIRRLELERKQAELNFQQFSQGTRTYEQYTASAATHSQPPLNQSESDNTRRRELGSQLQSAEARCKVLEKQLNYMKRMVENAEKEKNALTEKQASLQSQKPPSNTNLQAEKLEKLEKECFKLSKTQTLAEMKLAALEQKLLKEEHERKLVQEKADELQRELDIGLRLSPPATEEIKPKKKTKKSSKRSSKQSEPASPSCLRGKRMPFVAGTSTSPSHSVHANVQAILHMMKHHQPQLCERVRSLQRPGCGAKRSLRRDFSSSSSSSAPHKAGSEPEQAAQSLGSLSDLLLALQDELGQMSFEHQELVQQIDATHDRGLRDDLERELEGLVNKMEEKGVQITKLRKHQKTVLKLTQQTQHQAGSNELKAKKASEIRPPVPSPVRTQHQGRKGGATHNNLQLLKETQRFRNSLKQDDLYWET